MTGNRRARASVRLYAVLLRLLFPADFRRHYGEQMRRDFADLVGAATARAPSRGFARLWASELTDLTSAALQERLAVGSGVAGGVIVTLALGVGAAAAVFATLDAVVLSAVPYPDAHRLVLSWATAPRLGFDRAPWSQPNFVDLQERASTVVDLAAFSLPTEVSTSVSGSTVVATAVSPNLFEVVDARAELGRTLRAGDAGSADVPALVVSHDFWTDALNADSGAIGRVIQLGESDYRVVGVMPRRFAFPPEMSVGSWRLHSAHAWFALSDDVDPATRGRYFLIPIGRLAPDVSIEDARSTLTEIALALERSYPASNLGLGIGVWPLQDQATESLEPGFLLLLGCATLLLLLAGLHAATLQIIGLPARRSGRVGVRTALTDRLPLAIGAGLLAMAAAWAGARAIVALGFHDVPRLEGAHLGFGLLAVTFTVAFAITEILAVSTRATDFRRGDAAGGRGSSGRGGSSRVLRSLCAAELAIASVIALHGVDAYQHLARLSAVDPGFDSDGVLTVSVTPPPAHYPDREALAAFYLELAASLTSLSEVTSVGGVDLLPLGGEDASTGFLVEGRENDPRQIPRVHYRAALPCPGSRARCRGHFGGAAAGS